MFVDFLMIAILTGMRCHLIVILLLALTKKSTYNKCCWSRVQRGGKSSILLGLYLVTHLCLTLLQPLDYSLPKYSAHGNFQARMLEWVAISSSRGSSWPRDQTRNYCVSCTTGRCFTLWTIREDPYPDGGNVNWCSHYGEQCRSSLKS